MSIEIALKVDQNGMVLGARVHDGHLVSITFVVRDELTLKIRRTDDTTVQFKFAGIHDANINLWEGMIVSEVYAWKVNAAPQNLEIQDSGWNALFNQRLLAQDVPDAINRAIQRKPESFLIQVATSYGGSIIAICDSVHITEG